MTEQDRREFRNWVAAGMPDHPIFAPVETQAERAHLYRDRMGAGA